MREVLAQLFLTLATLLRNAAAKANQAERRTLSSEHWRPSAGQQSCSAATSGLRCCGETCDVPETPLAAAKRDKCD